MLIRNTAANLAAQLLYPVLGLVMVPFYVGHLGLEGYGLIGFMTLVVSLLSVFNRGLGSALQREISRRVAANDGQTLRRLLRSMELFYWGAAACLSLALAGLALLPGPGWIETSTLSPREITVCMTLLAARVALAFPHAVYQSVLIGTERQVLGSMLTASLALTSAAAGVVGVLVFGTVTAYYASETITVGIFLFIYRRAAYHVLPRAEARFDVAEIRGLVGISVALMWTSGIGLLLSTLDRLFVSAMLPVSSLAVYTIAVMGGRLVTLFYNPFLQAAYPEMCRAVRAGSAAEQARDLARNHAVLLLIAAGVGVPLCGFAPEALTIWVRDATVVDVGAPVLSIYVAGSLLIAFASVLYQWQTAMGRTAVAVRFNAAALVWFPIVLAALLWKLDLVGAAIAWTIYGAGAWVTNLLTTFGPNALPTYYLRTSLRMTAAALVPAVVFTVAARLLADYFFQDSLWGRTACGTAAALCAAAAAFYTARPHLGVPEGGNRGLASPGGFGRFGRIATASPDRN